MQCIWSHIREFRVALPWALLYADDLVVIAETEDQLIKRLNEWKDNVESRGMRVVTSAGCTSMDIGASAKLELVDKFCYLSDMLSVDGDADAAVEARIRIGWNKFWQMVPLLTNKDV